MLNDIKLRRLKSLSERIEPYDKSLAFELQKMIFNIENRNHKGKLVISEDVIGTLGKISGVSNGMALIGGMAVRYWVDSRTTDDVDFVVLHGDLKLIIDAYPDGKPNSFGYSIIMDGVNVDFLDASRFPYAKDAIDNSVSVNYAGTNVKIVKPEYLLLFKIESSRNIDFTDIVQLLMMDGVASKTRDLIYKHMPTNMEDFEQYVRMAEHGII